MPKFVTFFESGKEEVCFNIEHITSFTTITEGTGLDKTTRTKIRTSDGHETVVREEYGKVYQEVLQKES